MKDPIREILPKTWNLYSSMGVWGSLTVRAEERSLLRGCILVVIHTKGKLGGLHHVSWLSVHQPLKRPRPIWLRYLV